MILMGSYTPSKPLEIPANWRDSTPKKVAGAENLALLAAACQHAEHVPVK
jgi:hypothetical protein